MTVISNRQPPVDIEYDCRGKRKRKSLANVSAGRAKFFYQLKLKQGQAIPGYANPRGPITAPWCHQLFSQSCECVNDLQPMDCSVQSAASPQQRSQPCLFNRRPIPMTNAETKQRFVEACRKEWQRICFDILAVCPNGFHGWHAEQVQEVLADYIHRARMVEAHSTRSEPSA